MLLVIGPGLLFAAAWAMRYLSTAIGWGFVAAVLVTEVVLVIWVADLGDPAAPRARVCERPARCPLRSGHGPSLRREHPQEPRPHRRHGCSAHDRARARDLHRGARQRHEAVEPPRDRAAGEVVRTCSFGERVRLDLAERRRCDRQGAGSRGCLERPLRCRKGLGLGAADHRSRSEDDLPGLQLRVEGRIERVHRQPRRRTKRSSTRRSPTRRTSRWDRASAS